MLGYVDLHCHYLPAIDDGVKTIAEGAELCRALRSIGYDTVVATPHIRSAMFENNKANLEQVYSNFVAQTREMQDMPKTGLAAEHFCDDVFWNLFATGASLPYPGGHAALVEFPPTAIPRNVEQRFFDMQRKRVRPVIAHPERYTPLFKQTDPIDRMLDMGVLAQLDLMSLTGKYGRATQSAAERMVEEGVYYLACSDCHKPADVPIVADAIARLFELVGEEEAKELLSENPTRILSGRINA
ncbi:MAG: protein tyrosine phosphatase [Sandaracinaceae bacterium]|nr:protein tyrosine phosphatase [Sandaracinaceae bacterium]